MMHNYAELLNDPEVFDNSGANLAEYLLSKKNTRVPERIFNLRDGQEKENEDISIRMIQKKPPKPYPGSTRRPSNSSSYSSSNATFVGFKPGGTSTPFPTGQKPSFPRKIVSVPDKHKSIHTQTSKDSSTDLPIKTHIVMRKDSLNATKSNSIQNSRKSQSRFANPASIGNVPQDEPSLGIAPHAEEPMREAAQKRSPRPEFPEQQDIVTESYQKKSSSNTSLRVRDIRELSKSSVNAERDSLTKQKRCSVQEVVSNEESIIISDDEDPAEEEVQDSPPVPQQSHRRTIQSSQQIDMSPLPQSKRTSERSTKAPQKTITTAMSIAQDFATSSSDDEEEEPTLVPQREEREEEAPERSQLQLPTPQNDVTSGFVDLSSHTSRTCSARPKDRVQLFSVNTSVIPEVAEPQSTRPSIAHQISYLQSKTSSKVIDHSGVFKAPSNIVAKRTRRKKKLESPVQRMIHLEKSIRSSIPRTQGTSRRKLYSHSLNSQEDEVEAESNEINTPSCQIEPFNPIEEIVQDVELEAVEEVEIPACHVVVERVDVPVVSEPEPKKKTKKQTSKKQQIEEEKESSDEVVVRRSSRQRCAPKAFWLGRNHASQQLIVQNYNEKLPLRQRYARKDDPGEVNLHSDFSILISERNKRSKKQKKSEKKLRKNSAGEAQKKTQESDEVEPQLDAGQVDEPGPSRATEGRKKGEKSKKKKNKKHQDNSTGIQSEEPRVMSQEELIELARNGMERARVLDFGKNSCEFMYMKESHGIQMLTDGEDDCCGQFKFKPGAIKRGCRMINHICYFFVEEGSFVINVNGKLRDLKKNDRVIIYKDMKYALTYLNENKQHGKISFFKY